MKTDLTDIDAYVLTVTQDPDVKQVCVTIILLLIMIVLY